MSHTGEQARGHEKDRGRAASAAGEGPATRGTMGTLKLKVICGSLRLFWAFWAVLGTSQPATINFLAKTKGSHKESQQRVVCFNKN